MTVWENRLYIASGDYGANTGPTDVVSLNLADVGAGFTSEATLHTEEIWAYRPAGSRLLVPFIDPIGYEDGAQGQLAVATTPGSWSVIASVVPVPIHAFDVVETVDGLFLFGAANEPDPPVGGATVWRSTDDGVTWAVSLAPRPDPTGIARFYTPMIYPDGSIEVLLDTTPAKVLYRWDGTFWAVVTNQSGRTISDAIPFTYQGTPFQFCIDTGKPQSLVETSRWHIRTAAADDAVRDAITASIPVWRVRDTFTDGTTLWLLDQDGSIWAGDTTGAWERLFTLSVLPTALAVHDGTAYLGTADSKVYTTSLP